jgi:hypothetical protein
MPSNPSSLASINSPRLPLHFPFFSPSQSPPGWRNCSTEHRKPAGFPGRFRRSQRTPRLLLSPTSFPSLWRPLWWFSFDLFHSKSSPWPSPDAPTTPAGSPQCCWMHSTSPITQTKSPWTPVPRPSFPQLREAPEHRRRPSPVHRLAGDSSENQPGEPLPPLSLLSVRSRSSGLDRSTYLNRYFRSWPSIHP